MKLPFGKPGLSRFIFVALLLVFNWPLLSIPTGECLFAWLFAAWGLAIAILFTTARGAAGKDAAATADTALAPSGGPALPGPNSGQHTGPENRFGPGPDAGPDRNTGGTGAEERDV